MLFDKLNMFIFPLLNLLRRGKCGIHSQCGIHSSVEWNLKPFSMSHEAGAAPVINPPRKRVKSKQMLEVSPSPSLSSLRSVVMIIFSTNPIKHWQLLRSFAIKGSILEFLCKRSVTAHLTDCSFAHIHKYKNTQIHTTGQKYSILSQDTGDINFSSNVINFPFFRLVFHSQLAHGSPTGGNIYIS